MKESYVRKAAGRPHPEKVGSWKVLGALYFNLCFMGLRAVILRYVVAAAERRSSNHCRWKSLHKKGLKSAKAAAVPNIKRSKKMLNESSLL